MRGPMAIWFLLVMLAGSGAMADDMQAYLSQTEELARQGKHAEALERFIWFHEHALEHDAGMSGVRLSFALAYWKSLGEDYPPAQKALVELRDRSAKQVIESDGNWNLFQDVAALNRTLGETAKTVELFQAAAQAQPKMARRYWIAAKDAVIEAKRYDLAGKYIGNPASEFGRIKTAYDHTKTLYERPELGGERLKQFNEDHMVKASLQLIEVALALGQRQPALEIQAKALELVDDQRLRDAISADDAKDPEADSPAADSPPSR